MKTPEIFPTLHDETSSALQKIASYVGADENLIGSCFYGGDFSLYDTPDHLDSVKSVTHAFNEAARHARNLHRAITRMTPSQRAEINVAGCVTSFQIEHLADVLAQDAESLAGWSRTKIRTGGRNPAAYGVASGVYRIFRRLRKDITFGQNADGGPSTDFGKTVQFALGAFGIKADWRRPAQSERDRFFNISTRYERLKARLPQIKLMPKPDSVSISFWRNGSETTYTFRAEDRPNVGAHEVCGCRFRSGAEVEHYAFEWYSKLNANS